MKRFMLAALLVLAAISCFGQQLKPGEVKMQYREAPIMVARGATSAIPAESVKTDKSLRGYKAYRVQSHDIQYGRLPNGDEYGFGYGVEATYLMSPKGESVRVIGTIPDAPTFVTRNRAHWLYPSPEPEWTDVRPLDPALLKSLLGKRTPKEIVLSDSTSWRSVNKYDGTGEFYPIYVNYGITLSQQIMESGITLAPNYAEAILENAYPVTFPGFSSMKDVELRGSYDTADQTIAADRGFGPGEIEDLVALGTQPQWLEDGEIIGAHSLRFYSNVERPGVYRAAIQKKNGVVILFLLPEDWSTTVIYRKVRFSWPNSDGGKG